MSNWSPCAIGTVLIEISCAGAETAIANSTVQRPATRTEGLDMTAPRSEGCPLTYTLRFRRDVTCGACATTLPPPLLPQWRYVGPRTATILGGLSMSLRRCLVALTIAVP